MGSSHGTTIAHYFHLSSIDEVLGEEDELGTEVAQIGEFEDEFVDERNSETAIGAYIDDSFLPCPAQASFIGQWADVASE